MLNRAERTPCLYAITPDMADTGRLVQQVGQAIRGGARLVQYRNKRADAALRLQQARELLAVCRAMRVPLLINDHLDLAMQIGADGLHLGGDDGDLAAARQELGPHRLLGASCYGDLALAERALAAGASYVAFGALFTSGSKPEAARTTLSVLEEARRLPCPVCAIGGITASNAAQAVAAGAQWLAVIGGLFSGGDVQHNARQLTQAMRQGLARSGA